MPRRPNVAVYASREGATTAYSTQDSAEAQQVAAITTLKQEERRMGELRTQFAAAVQSLDAEVAYGSAQNS